MTEKLTALELTSRFHSLHARINALSVPIFSFPLGKPPLSNALMRLARELRDQAYNTLASTALSINMVSRARGGSEDSGLQDVVEEAMLQWEQSMLASDFPQEGLGDEVIPHLERANILLLSIAEKLVGEAERMMDQALR